MEDFLTMSRKQLQALCKKHGVPANLKNAEMAQRLSLLLKDEEVQGKEDSSSGPGSGGLDKEKVEGKKRVRFSPTNDVYEFVDKYTEAVEQEHAEAKRERASKRGFRKKEMKQAEEMFGDQVRVTRSRKANVILSPPLRKRAKTGGKTSSETFEKESCSNFGVVDCIQTNASKVKESDEIFAAGKGEALGEIVKLDEVNGLESEPIVVSKSAADVLRRTRSQRNVMGDEASVMISGHATKPVTENDLLTGHCDVVQNEVPLRKSTRGAMKNISNMHKIQKRGNPEVLKKQDRKKSNNEFPIVVSGSKESNKLEREEEQSVCQIKEDHIISKPLSYNLSTSGSSTVVGLEVDSSNEHQKTCGSLVLELPMVKPQRRSIHKNDGWDALGLSDVNTVPTESNQVDQPLKQTITDWTECCHDVATSNDCSENKLIEEPVCFTKKANCENKHHKRRKRSARLGQGNSKSIKNCLGKSISLHKTDVLQSKDAKSDCLLSISEVAKNGTCSSTLSGSEMHGKFVEAGVLTDAALLIKSSTQFTTEETSDADMRIPFSVPAVEESRVNVCVSLQYKTLTADPVQIDLGCEESNKLSEASGSFSYDLPYAGCTRDELGMSTHEPAEGLPDQSDSNLKKAVIYKLSTECKDVFEITNDWAITKELTSKQKMVDGQYKDIFRSDAEQDTEARLVLLNEKIILSCRSNKNKADEDQDKNLTDECQFSLDTPASEVVKILNGDLNKDDTTSDDHCLENKQAQSSCISTTDDAKDGNCSLEFVKSTPENQLTNNEVYFDDIDAEKRMSREKADSCKLDGRSNSEEKVTVVQLGEPLTKDHQAEKDLSAEINTKMDDSASETEVLYIEAGIIGSPEYSLSLIVAGNEFATNYLDAEPSHELDKEFNDSLPHVTSVHQISGDTGMNTPAATENEFYKDKDDAYIDEVHTTFLVTTSETCRYENITLDDAVSSDDRVSFHGSQAEREAEVTTDTVGHSTQVHSLLSIEDFSAEKGSESLNTVGQLNTINQDISEAFTSECMERNKISLCNSETSQLEEIVSFSCQNSPSCAGAFIKPYCAENLLNGQSISISEEAIDENNIAEYSMCIRQAESSSSIGSKVDQSIRDVMIELEDGNTIPELGDIQAYHAPGDLHNLEGTSMDFVVCHDAQLVSTSTYSENKARTEICDVTLVNPDACRDYGMKNCSGGKQIIMSKDTCVSLNGVQMAKESASCSKFPSFVKLDELLREIDDYFEWRNTEVKFLDESDACGDTKEVMHLDVENLTEIPINTDYGINLRMNGCKCNAGIDVDICAAPQEGHGKPDNEIGDGDYEHVDDQVDHHGYLLLEECSIQNKLEIYAHQYLTAVREEKLASPSETAIGLLSGVGLDVLPLDKDVHQSDEQNLTVSSVNTKNNCEVMDKLNPQIPSSLNCKAEKSELSPGLVAKDTSWKNNQETTSKETNYSMPAYSSNKAKPLISMAMKENFTPLSKTESMKCPKAASINRRKVLDSVQNN